MAATDIGFRATIEWYLSSHARLKEKIDGNASRNRACGHNEAIQNTALSAAQEGFSALRRPRCLDSRSAPLSPPRAPSELPTLHTLPRPVLRKILRKLGGAS